MDNCARTEKDFSWISYVYSDEQDKPDIGTFIEKLDVNGVGVVVVVVKSFCNRKVYF